MAESLLLFAVEDELRNKLGQFHDRMEARVVQKLGARQRVEVIDDALEVVVAHFRKHFLQRLSGNERAFVDFVTFCSSCFEQESTEVTERQASLQK